MKDEHDKSTIELADIAVEQPHHVPQGRGAAVQEAKKPRPKRLTNQSSHRPPLGAKPEVAGFEGFGRSVLSVSATARDWGVSSRRIRTLLSTGRLNGRQHENGYWEVYYPYRFIFGTRGPEVKKQQRQPDKPKAKKPEHSPVMVSLKTLTTKEKNMNMAKLGTVSLAGNSFRSVGTPRKQRAGGMTRYTLCVSQKTRTD